MGQVFILVLVLAVLVVLALILFTATREEQVAEHEERLKARVPDAKVDDYERPASLVAEQIEEMVKKKIETYPDLADTLLDFGTVADGSIDIWVNKTQYDNVEDIPDERIREAIKEAVATFNKQ